MNIRYVMHARLPTERAHGTQVAKMCESFAKAGANVSLVLPGKRSGGVSDDIFSYYNVSKSFRIVRLRSTDLLGKTLRFGRLFYWIDMLTFLFSLAFTREIAAGDVVYVRDPMLLKPFSRGKHLLCAEIHDIPEKKGRFMRQLRKAHKVIALNDIVRRELVEMGFPEKDMIAAGDGVDLAEFDVALGQTDARRALGLPEDAKIVLYTGHLYAWKGAHNLAEAAKLLPQDVVTVLVGGVDRELEEFQSKFGDVPNVRVVPFVPRDRVPAYLKAADVLAIPNSASSANSAKYTSPLKLFEYMASKRPIVASDLPSMRQVLDESNCVFVRPDDPPALAEAIMSLVSDPSLSTVKMGKAFEDVQRHTWTARGERIIAFLHNGQAHR